jgi:aspartate/methionine/tyrosine aminotransferase
MKTKRKLTPRYRLANIRRKLWKHKPEQMEAIRIRAIARAKQIKDEKYRKLFIFLQGWPDKITPEQLKQLITDEIEMTNKHGKQMHVRSFMNKLTRRQLLKYDAGLGKWINLTLLQLP